jgi:hypothetical protein
MLRTLESRLPNSPAAAWIAGLALSAVLAAAGGAEAAESAIPLTPSGGTDIGQALLPAPGLYGAFATLPFNQDDRLYDNKGAPVSNAGNVALNMQTVAFALSYVYPVKVFGGSVASDLSVPITSITYKLGNAHARNTTGVGDLYSDLFTWSRHIGPGAAASGTGGKGFTMAFGLAMKMPTGSYNTLKNQVNIGNNVFVFVPNAAVTYTGQGIKGFSDDTQLSMKVFFGAPTENPHTNYHSGDATSVDFSATQAFGRLRAGLAGTFSTQVTDDRLPDGSAPPMGKKFQQFQVGPVLAYAIPNTRLSLKFKYLRTVYVRSDINDQFLLAALAAKF